MSSHARLLASLAAIALIVSQPAVGQNAATAAIDVHLEPQRLEDALLNVSRASGRQIVFDADLVAGKRIGSLSGHFTPQEAVRRLLQGTGLAVREEAGALVVVGVPDPLPGADVVVTGSRIRGAQQYAPVTAISREALRAQGQTNLGDAVRTIPQNFGGGQSPFVGLGAEDFGSINLNSGTSVNLRGLGPDATLTLLNGRRLAYDGVFEGVDIAAIPLAAIDRIEVVADGASAIYGSDAVAGVVNVGLRRDFKGVETSARVGAATDGGDVQQQYEGVVGTIWSNGGLVATVDYDRNSAVTANQRPFSDTLDHTTTILPSTRHLGAVFSGHQSIGSRVEFDLDALYSRRSSFSAFPNADNSTYLESGIDRRPVVTSLAISPVLKLDLGGSWRATLAGTFGHDNTHYQTRYFSAGGVTADYTGIYANQSVSVEATAEGALMTLPGGEARLAGGGGYRRVSLVSSESDGTTNTTDIDASRDSYYAFGELNVPIIGSGNGRRGLERLSVDIAGRFEHYPQIGSVFTPKIGVIYSPAQFLELRGTWGRSFKAPTLYQLYQTQGALLYPASVFGGVGYPATATGLYAYGGNANLKPQRATSWSAGVVLTPFADRRLTVEATYFATDYTDRIVAPITSATTALSDPSVADLIQLNPSAATINTLLSNVPLGLLNLSGAAYDPANVVAIIDDRNHNVASQDIHGADISATWRITVGQSSSIALNASATYLASRQRISPDQPSVQLAGTIFEPPHFRGRGGASLTSGPWTSSLFVTTTAGVDDTRYTPVTRVPGQTTIDLSGGYAVPSKSGPLHGVSIQLSALNILDNLPARIRTAYAFYTPFDATNYSPVGRLVSLTVSKRW